MAITCRQQGLTLLRQACGDPSADFREGQWEAIQSLVEQRARLLVVQRTGWGKSLVYFLATRLLRDRGAGPTLLISPLLSLMRNQLLAAARLGVRADTINSSNYEDWDSVRARLRTNKVDVLLISPERLASDTFHKRVLLPLANRIGLFVVDEAHCISDWGHDFRPDYRRITRILQALPPNIPVLATTATANDRVVEDILGELGPKLRLLRGHLARESLQLQNLQLPAESSRMAWLAEQLPRLPGSGIIYTLTIKDAQRVAAWLQSQGIDAHAYWGALETAEREALEERLLNNEIKALVATVALGMGFDKPDLGFVIHYQRPRSVVDYYQQVGRAGRALDQAYGILLGGSEDTEIAEYFIRTAFPLEADVEAVLSVLSDAKHGLTLEMLEQQVNVPRRQIEQVLKTLAVMRPAPVSMHGLRWYANPVRYVPDHERIERLTRIRRDEQAHMLEYMQNRECLMRFLARELDDPNPVLCGRCAVCRGEPLLPEGYSMDLARRAVRFLRGSTPAIEPHRYWPEDALAAHGWCGEIPRELQARPGRALCVWGDDGWGTLVRHGKQKAGYFDYTLVAAVVTMVREQWRPWPPPSWITCVPSLNHPELVPVFAQRVSEVLNIPFIPAVRKIRATQPQKEMQNDYQQARNLANAFAVEPWPGLGGPVLLLDDMVDSGWTFAVVAALLRNAGSGPVFPLALAVTTKTGSG